MERTNQTLSLGQLLPKQQQTDGERYKMIDLNTVSLSEEEKEAALANALERKLKIVDEHNRIALRYQQEYDSNRKWTTQEYFQYVQYQIQNNPDYSGFKIDAENHETIKALCEYFAKDDRFVSRKEGYSLQKGLMLFGNVGCGKTTLMRLFSRNTKRCFTIMDCQSIADKFSSRGSEILHMYSGSIDVPNSYQTYFQTKIGICYDDLGTERLGKHYADSANTMEQLLLLRYSKRDLPWNYTHITTNLKPEEIETNYGSRVRSRLREMFNMIILPGDDRRI